MEIDKIAFIYIRDMSVLATVSKGRDLFYMPGVQRERGETDEQTLIREIKEELSVNIISQSIRYYGTFTAQAHAKPKGTVVKITCYTGEFAGELKPSSGIEKMKSPL